MVWSPPAPLADWAHISRIKTCKRRKSVRDSFLEGTPDYDHNL